MEGKCFDMPLLFKTIERLQQQVHRLFGSAHAYLTKSSQSRLHADNGKAYECGIDNAKSESDRTAWTDEKGFEWKPYSIEFESADGTFCFEIWAISFEHAELLIQDIRQTAKLSGEIIGVIDANK